MGNPTTDTPRTYEPWDIKEVIIMAAVIIMVLGGSVFILFGPMPNNGDCTSHSTSAKCNTPNNQSNIRRH